MKFKKSFFPPILKITIYSINPTYLKKLKTINKYPKSIQIKRFKQNCSDESKS